MSLLTNKKKQEGRLIKFLSRNPELNFRTHQGLTFSRAKRFGFEATAKFYVLFEPGVDSLNYASNRLYNVYERGINTTQHKHISTSFKEKTQYVFPPSSRTGLPHHNCHMQESSKTLYSYINKLPM
jgi:hypothetical protein